MARQLNDALLVGDGVELYHPSSTPHVDFHRASSPAGDGGVSYDVRLVNDANGWLHLVGGALSVDSYVDSGVARIYEHDSTYAGFRHKNHAGAYQILCRDTGLILIRADGSDERVLLGTSAAWYVDMQASRTQFNHPVYIGAAHALQFSSYGGGWFMQDTIWLRTYGDKGIWAGTGTIATNGKFSAGAGGGTVTEDFHSASSTAGYSFVSRNGGSRWVLYSTSSICWLYETGASQSMMFVRPSSGNVGAGHAGAGGRTEIGPWQRSSTAQHAYIGNNVRADANPAHYMMIAGHTDNNLYIARPGGSSGFFFRTENNGSNLFHIGTAGNQSVPLSTNVNVRLPALGGETMILTAFSGSWQMGYSSSSRRVKENIRPLRGALAGPGTLATDDPRSGRNNPVFKLRPVRHRWKHDPKGINGIANGNEMNRRHPDGVAGLIAEEVAEWAPDAVFQPEQPTAWHDDPEKVLPSTDPETGEPMIDYTVEPTGVASIDNDRLMAYVIDAVQYLLGRLEAR